MPASILASQQPAFRGGGVFSPASLFASGEQGLWIDPSDLSTLFQDTAGTIPVTAPGQTVALALDKSGRGNHLSQATAASRPVYNIGGDGKPFLFFDGIDDFLTRAAGGQFTSTDEMTMFAAVRKLTSTSDQHIGGLGAGGPGGSTVFWAPQAAGNYTYWSSGTINVAVASPSIYPEPSSNVITGLSKISAPSVTVRVDGTPTTSTAGQGTGNYGNLPIFVGLRNGSSSAWNGCLYGFIMRGILTSAPLLTNTETWLANKNGV